MKNLLRTFIFLSMMCTGIIVQSQSNKDFMLVHFNTKDGGEIEGAYFQGDEDLVVIFAHGAVFNKESWYFLCRELKDRGVSSLAIDFRGYGNSTKGDGGNLSYDVLGAVNFVKKRNLKSVALVGGSMGGAAVLSALENNPDPVITKTVLLAPAGGKGIQSGSIQKLFIVAEKEGGFARVKRAYDESADPKQIEIFEGSAHAQHMFKEGYADKLTKMIIEFLIK